MQILLNLSTGADQWLKNPPTGTSVSRMLGLSIKPLLHALVVVNRLYLRLHPDTPLLYDSSVKYKEEPKDTIEEFASIPVVLQRGWGDCDDLAPFRCAELREMGEQATIRVQWRKKVNGRLYHILVRHEDGALEDPSRILGMGSRHATISAAKGI